MGRAYRMEDAPGRYIVFLKNTFPRELSMEGMKIVLDTANGATYRVAPAAFTELGADVEVIHNEPNGLNINERCGSQYTQDLEKRVVETGSAIGLAFDGDGDRLIAVDEKGKNPHGRPDPDHLRQGAQGPGRVEERPAREHGHEQSGTDRCLQEIRLQTPCVPGRRPLRAGGHAAPGGRDRRRGFRSHDLSGPPYHR